MWQHNYEPIAGSLGLSALVAAIPIVVLFTMLGVLRKPAWVSALSGLASAFIVALLAYGMPFQLALLSTVYGAAYGLFPIAWIVFASIMLYRLAVDTAESLYRLWAQNSGERRATFRELGRGMAEVMRVYLELLAGQFHSRTIAEQWRESYAVFLRDLERAIDRVRF